MGQDATGAHGDHLVPVTTGLVEVVEHRHDGGAQLGVQVPAQLEEVHLVGQVQVGGRLVEQEDVGALGQGHRHPHPLTLPAGECGHVPVGQANDVGALHGLGDGRVVVGRPLTQERLIRVAPARHQLVDGDPGRGDGGLGQHAHSPGQLLGGQGGGVAAVEDHLPGARGEDPTHGAQQRGLPAGIRAHDHRHRARGDGRAQVLDDRMAGMVGQADAPDAQARSGDLGVGTSLR